MGRFARHQRSLSKEDFKRVFKDNDQTKSEGLRVLSQKSKLGAPRLGLAISKKHLLRAVDRNRVKRVVRESFQQHQSLIASYDVVVISQPGLGKQSNQQIFRSLVKHWRTVNKKTK